MATISQKRIVDDIIHADGHYEGDPRIVRIVEYQNVFNGEKAWGLIYEGEDLSRYHSGEAATINPTTIWEAK